MKKIALLFSSILLLVGALLSVPTIAPAHGQTTGTVCIIPNNASSCPASPALMIGAVGTQLKVSVFIENSGALNGFDIILLADHTILKPIGADLNGTVLPPPKTIIQECIGNIEIISGVNCSPTTDTADTLHFAALACSGCITTASTTGLLFHAIYNVTSTTSGTSLTFQTGCSGTSVSGGVCVTITNGTVMPVPETVQTATFSTSLASPAISTALSATTIPIGRSVYDNATLQGTTATPGGTVSYTVFYNGACSPIGSVVSVVTVTNGAVPGSRSVFFNSSGTFSWRAMYGGDSNNNGATSPCEPMTVCKCAPSLATTLTATTISVGGSVSDSATLTGTFQATGTVTYLLYSTGTCSSTSNTVSIVTVTNNVVPSSRLVTFNSTGSFSWQAIYSGDANNNAVESPCEPMSVVGPDFAMTATPSSLTITAGSSAASTITLTSLNSFNGTVSLTTSPPPLCPACSTWSISPTSVALSPNGSANATLTIFAGTQASSGNVTVFGKSGSLSHSVSVTFTVATPDFTITASPSSRSVSKGSSTSFTIKVTGTKGFNDTVTLSATISPLVHHGPTTSLPSTVGPYSTSTLTVLTARNTPIGAYTIMVTATSGLLTHTVSVTVIVTH